MSDIKEANFFVVGLWNPKPKYKNTRHNAGAMTLDFIQDELGFSRWEEDENGKFVFCEGEIENANVFLVKPLTFMNNSGSAVSSVLSKASASVEKIVLIYDDLDSVLSSVKRKENGGAGGHNGVSDVIEKLGTDEFKRIKIGIAKEGKNGEALKFKNKDRSSEFVLSRFGMFEKRILKKESFKKVKSLLTDIIKNAKNQ